MTSLRLRSLRHLWELSALTRFMRSRCMSQSVRCNEGNQRDKGDSLQRTRNGWTAKKIELKGASISLWSWIWNTSGNKTRGSRTHFFKYSMLLQWSNTRRKQDNWEEFQTSKTVQVLAFAYICSKADRIDRSWISFIKHVTIWAHSQPLGYGCKEELQKIQLASGYTHLKNDLGLKP